MNKTNTRRIDGDCWEGVLDHKWHLEAALPTDLDRALEQLDGETFTLLTIGGDGEQHMGIGGGKGRYVVYATFDNEEFWNLLCAQPREGVIFLTAGGQEGDFPARQVVDLEQARAAAQTFLLHGQLDQGQRWEKQ